MEPGLFDLNDVILGIPHYGLIKDSPSPFVCCMFVLTLPKGKTEQQNHQTERVTSTAIIYTRNVSH